MKYRVLAAAAAAVTVGLAAAACSSPDSSVPVSAASPGSHVVLATVPADAGAAEAAGLATSRPSGPGCASMPARGAGSLAGMAADPFATAASDNPMLSDLAAALRKAMLFAALNDASALTVFAPDNAAFAQIPAASLAAISASEPELAKTLTDQVVIGRVTPAQLASGRTLRTLGGGTISTARNGGLYQVNSAHVVCGPVQTVNATVYITSAVLTP